MNIVANIYIYLIIAGLLSGLVINVDYKQCGTLKSGQFHEHVVKSLLWPVILTSAMVAQKDAFPSPVCER